MRLSAFSVVDEYPPGPYGTPERARDVLHLAEAADAAGLSTLWIAEHHFQPGGVCPAPPVLLAACGERTRRLRLGVLVSVLPFHRPVELAEQYALLDRLLGGRLNLGVGSGYIPLEFQGFGVDPATKRERFDAALATLLAALAGEEVRAADGAAPVRLNVRPVQQPHPPVWVAVQRREAIAHVARTGRSIALVPYATVADLDELAAEVREYRAALPAGVPGEVAAAVHLYAGDRPEVARAALQRYLDSRLRTQSTFYAQKVARDPHHADAEALERSGFALFGPADDVAQRLRAYARIGIDEVLGIFDFGGLPPEAVRASVTALGAAFAQP
ncbi:MAG TPA: LLM class flavin-dependent oxidoreductase [Thermoplasmata archaeon]|nr:LLM class flavin-dependent oxidoreductase [Thermoplasmata archaeon]